VCWNDRLVLVKNTRKNNTTPDERKQHNEREPTGTRNAEKGQEERDEGGKDERPSFFLLYGAKRFIFVLFLFSFFFLGFWASFFAQTFSPTPLWKI